MNLRAYLVTGETLSAGRSTVEVVEAAIAGEIDVVQLREKRMTARDRYKLGQELRDLTRETDVTLVVDDRVGIAAAIDETRDVPISELPIEQF